MDPESKPDLDELVLRCLSRIEIDGDAAVDAECGLHPELAPAIRRRLQLLREAGLVGSAGALAGDFPERLGDFRLLRRLGGGGMGVVYAAEQTSLGRRVALKLIRPEHLYFPGARSRFAREAQAIARLAHPGIVPVHAIGEESGIPYLAMELIEGASLAAVLASLAGREPGRLRGTDLHDAICARADLPSLEADRAAMPFAAGWFDACAWIARELAQALEHAHQRGVVHRDVKPSNVMLTPSGRVMLVDFGLASTEGGDGLTRTGSALGSLPYMAPEQVAGRADLVGPRTDIYGLGVALYECLTLRRPFESDDATVLRTAILDARATRLRTLAPAAPRELEAVVSVAMAPETLHRYRSAADLARDLTHVLAREPIEARPSGTLTRLRRWAQRNPARALAAALAALVGIGAPLSFGLAQRRIAAQERGFNEQLGDANLELEKKGVDLAAALARESEERERAQENFEHALDAVDTMLTRVGSETLAYVPQMEGVRRELLEDALEFYAGFVEQGGDDPRVRMRRAVTQRKVGYLRKELGQLGAAREVLAESVATLRELEAAGFADPDLHFALCTALAEHADVLLAMQAFDEAEAIQREVLDRFDAAVEPSEYERTQRPVMLQHLAFLLRDTGRVDEAIPHARRAVDELRALAAEAPGDFDLRHRLGVALLTLANLAAAKSTTAETERLFLEALEAVRAALAGRPGHPPYRESLASGLGSLGWLLSPAELDHGFRAAGPSAEEALREAIDINTALIAEYPLRSLYPANIAGECANLCIHLARTGRLADARPFGERAIEAFETLIALEPEVADHQSDLGASLCNLAMLELNQGAPEKALALLDRAIEAHRAAIEAEPKNADFRRHVRQYLAGRGMTLIRLGRWGETLEVLREFEAAYSDRNARLWAAERRVECAVLVEKDASLSDAERAARGAELRDESVERLGKLVDLGVERTYLAESPWLEPLRDHPGFRALIE